MLLEKSLMDSDWTHSQNCSWFSRCKPTVIVWTVDSAFTHLQILTLSRCVRSEATMNRSIRCVSYRDPQNGELSLRPSQRQDRSYRIITPSCPTFYQPWDFIQTYVRGSHDILINTVSVQFSIHTFWEARLQPFIFIESLFPIHSSVVFPPINPFSPLNICFEPPLSDEVLICIWQM